MEPLGQDALKAAITRGEIILGGAGYQVHGAAYHFLPGKIFPGGLADASQVIDLGDGDGLYLVPPGGMVMVRTKETVMMPRDHGGLWCQVHHLSRAGLMLINTASVVEPGYQGPLSCTFVNVGRTAARIAAGDAIAKLLFVPVPPSGDSAPFGKLAEAQGHVATALRRYDRDLLDRATDAPAMFLNTDALVQEITRRESERLQQRLEDSSRVARDRVDEARQRGEEALESRASEVVRAAERQEERLASVAEVIQGKVENANTALDASMKSAKAELAEAAAKARENELKAFRADIRAYVFRPGLLAAVLLAGLAFLWAWVPTLQHWFEIDDYSLTTAEWEDALEKAGEKAGVRRVEGTNVFLVDDAGSLTSAEERIKELEERVKALEAQLVEPADTDAPSSP